MMESDHEGDENEYEGNNEVYNEANEFEFYWKRKICSPCQTTKNVLVRHIHSLFFRNKVKKNKRIFNFLNSYFVAFFEDSFREVCDQEPKSNRFD